MAGHHYEIFKKHILSLSEEDKDIKKALLEWDLLNMTDLGDYGESGECCCEHPIRYEYLITNTHNGNNTVVGSKCIQHITRENEMDDDSKKDGKPNLGLLVKKVESVRKRLSSTQAPKPLRLAFGKHEGTLFTEVPASYIKWFSGQEYPPSPHHSASSKKKKINNNMQDFHVFTKYIYK